MRRIAGELSNRCQAIIAILLVLIPGTAYAYIGPGLGLGTFGIILGVLGSIVLALFAVLWYPIKRLLKKNQQPKEKESTNNDLEEDNEDKNK